MVSYMSENIHFLTKSASQWDDGCSGGHQWTTARMCMISGSVWSSSCIKNMGNTFILNRKHHLLANTVIQYCWKSNQLSNNSIISLIFYNDSCFWKNAIKCIHNSFVCMPLRILFPQFFLYTPKILSTTSLVNITLSRKGVSDGINLLVSQAMQKSGKRLAAEITLAGEQWFTQSILTQAWSFAVQHFAWVLKMSSMLNWLWRNLVVNIETDNGLIKKGEYNASIVPVTPWPSLSTSPGQMWDTVYIH